MIEAFKATGPGWETRINSILALAIRPLARNLDGAEAIEQRAKRARELVRRRR